MTINNPINSAGNSFYYKQTNNPNATEKSENDKVSIQFIVESAILGGDARSAIKIVNDFKNDKTIMRKALVTWLRLHEAKSVDLKNKIDVAMVQWIIGDRINGIVGFSFKDKLAVTINGIKDQSNIKKITDDTAYKAPNVLMGLCSVMLADDISGIGTINDPIIPYIATAAGILFVMAKATKISVGSLSSNDLQKIVNDTYKSFVDMELKGPTILINRPEIMDISKETKYPAPLVNKPKIEGYLEDKPEPIILVNKAFEKKLEDNIIYDSADQIKRSVKEKVKDVGGSVVERAKKGHDTLTITVPVQVKGGTALVETIEIPISRHDQDHNNIKNIFRDGFIEIDNNRAYITEPGAFKWESGKFKQIRAKTQQTSYK